MISNLVKQRIELFLSSSKYKSRIEFKVLDRVYFINKFFHKMSLHRVGVGLPLLFLEVYPSNVNSSTLETILDVIEGDVL